MAKLRNLPFLPFIVTISISVVIFWLIIFLRSAGYLEYVELLTYDWVMRLQPKKSSSPSPIIIIGVTEKDIRNQGRWPITDATLAQTLDILIRCEARTIGMDIFRDIRVPPGSMELDSMLRDHQNIIAVMKFGDNGVPPPQVINNPDRIGFNDILVDRGGIVRRGLLFLDDGENVFYSFALQLALKYLLVEGILPQPDASHPEFIALGRTTIPPFEPNDGAYVRADARGYQFLIDFDGTLKEFQSYSLTSLLSGDVPVNKIRDKFVIIGIMAHSVKDFFYTPQSRGFRIQQQIPGVVIHAHIANQLLKFAHNEKHPRKSISEKQERLWILFWSLIGGLIGFRVRSLWYYTMAGSIILLILFLITYLSFIKSWWIPLVPPAVVWIVSASIVTAYMSNHEKKQRSLLMQLFSSYVSAEVADSIWQRRDEFLSNGRPRPQKLTATVLFSDLKGYTSLSEQMEPGLLVDWLNTYMESMASLIMNHGGVIDDYAGDGIKANFGVPIPRNNRLEISQDAINAVNCALAMEEEIQRLNNLWRDLELPNTRIRIGIFTGPVVAAALGSTKRLKYTTIGDTVNIAARLESFDKEFAKESFCRILVGESTYCYLDEKFTSLLVGKVSLKGKEKKVSIYHILSKRGNTP